MARERAMAVNVEYKRKPVAQVEYAYVPQVDPVYCVLGSDGYIYYIPGSKLFLDNARMITNSIEDLQRLTVSPRTQYTTLASLSFAAKNITVYPTTSSLDTSVFSAIAADLSAFGGVVANAYENAFDIGTKAIEKDIKEEAERAKRATEQANRENAEKARLAAIEAAEKARAEAEKVEKQRQADEAARSERLKRRADLKSARQQKRAAEKAAAEKAAAEKARAEAEKVEKQRQAEAAEKAKAEAEKRRQADEAQAQKLEAEAAAKAARLRNTMLACVGGAILVVGAICLCRNTSIVAKASTCLKTSYSEAMNSSLVKSFSSSMLGEVFSKIASFFSRG